MELHWLRETLHRLPSFALPHKRFVSQVLQDKAQAFLGSETSTYRGSCQFQGRSLVYDDRQDGPLTAKSDIDGKVTAKSDIHIPENTKGVSQIALRYVGVQHAIELPDLARLEEPPCGSRRITAWFKRG